MRVPLIPQRFDYIRLADDREGTVMSTDGATLRGFWSDSRGQLVDAPAAGAVVLVRNHRHVDLLQEI